MMLLSFRYTNNDEDLPGWFVSDERKHNRKQLPITKDQIQAYKTQLKAIDARPIKKIAEAKARKKKRVGVLYRVLSTLVMFCVAER